MQRIRSLVDTRQTARGEELLRALPEAARLSHEADVTVLLSVKQKVAENFAFRPGELNDAAIERILAAVSRLADMKGGK